MGGRHPLFELYLCALTDCVGLDGAGKTTVLSHLNQPYQHFLTTYTNPLLAPDQSAAQAAKAHASEQKTADGESKTTASDTSSKTVEGKTDAEAKTTTDGESEEKKEALVPVPDLVPFDDIILPTCGVHLSEFEHQGQCVRAWDLSGQGKFRPLWEEYFQKVGCQPPALHRCLRGLLHFFLSSFLWLIVFSAVSGLAVLHRHRSPPDLELFIH